MFRFGSPNIRKMTEDRDFDGLTNLLKHSSPHTRLQAAEALAGMEDGRGWRYLLDTVRDPSDPLIQAAAAEILGGLGHPRAVAALKEAELSARDEAAEAIQEALHLLEGPGEATSDSDEAVRLPERQPDGRGFMGSLVGSMAAGESGMDKEFFEPSHPAAFTAGHIEIQPAETHLNNAVELRESEMQERGLVEASLAGWLRPEWGQVWFVRGVLLEDLEREHEALLAYHQALVLDSSLLEAREAHAELLDSMDPPAEPAGSGRLSADSGRLSADSGRLSADSGQGSDALLSDLASADWRERRDALAALTEHTKLDHELVLTHLLDAEREVRHAAIEAISRLHIQAAVPALLEQRESSWLLRFAILDALSALGAVDALVDRLRGEMTSLQERNPVFTSAKDPLVELEFDLLLEVGLLALTRTGDVAGLLAQAEGNAWEIVEDDEEFSEPEPGQYEAVIEADDEESQEFEDEADEDLLSYVDETGLMVAQALERLAGQRLAELSDPLLRRLAEIPDLTLLDLSDENSQPATAYDFAVLRTAAAAERQRRAAGG